MSNRKRISNTFVVNTVEDGKSIATVLLSPNSVYFDADSWGYAINDNDRFKVNYEMRVGDESIPDNKITIEDVTYDGDGRIYYNSNDYDNEVEDDYNSDIVWNNIKDGNLYFHIIKSLSPHVNGIIRVTLSCTYNGIEYTAVGECNVLPNKQGSAGKMFYYAGVWEDLLDNPNTALVVTSQQAPFVSYTHEKNPNVKLFAIFDAPPSNYTISFIVNNLRMVDNNYLPDTSKDGTYWKPMYNDFTYLITKAIFGDFAKFGSAIISGDWMISQHGTIYDTTGASHIIDTNNSWKDNSNNITYTVDNAYTLFNPSYPNSNQSGKVNFIPNYAVDLKSGKTFQHDAYISGTVEATSGKIGGFNIGTDEKQTLTAGTLTAGSLKMNGEGIRYEKQPSTDYHGRFDLGVGTNVIGGIDIEDSISLGESVKRFICALQLGARTDLDIERVYACSALDIKDGWITGIKRQIFSVSDVTSDSVDYFTIVCDIDYGDNGFFNNAGDPNHRYYQYHARSGATVIVDTSAHIQLPHDPENGTFYTFINIWDDINVKKFVIAQIGNNMYGGDNTYYAHDNKPRAMEVQNATTTSFIFYNGWWYKM